MVQLVSFIIPVSVYLSFFIFPINKIPIGGQWINYSSNVRVADQKLTIIFCLLLFKL